MRGGDPIRRFWSRVKKGRGCWNWTGNVLCPPAYPYGRFKTKGVEYKAHVFCWIIVNGATRGLCVLHKCDNPRCVNPKHLFLGTRGDNNRDCHKKGRANHPTKIRGYSHWRKGESNSNSKLTEAEVLEIRRTYKFKTRGRGAHTLARRFNVSKPVILGIIHRKGWSHV